MHREILEKQFFNAHQHNMKMDNPFLSLTQKEKMQERIAEQQNEIKSAQSMQKEKLAVTERQAQKELLHDYFEKKEHQKKLHVRNN